MLSKYKLKCYLNRFSLFLFFFNTGFVKIYPNAVVLMLSADLHSKNGSLWKNTYSFRCLSLEWSVWDIFFSLPLPQMNFKANRHLVVYFENQTLQGASVFSRVLNTTLVPLKSRGSWGLLGGTGPQKSQRIVCNNSSFSLHSTSQWIDIPNYVSHTEHFFTIQNPISFIGTLDNKICMVKNSFLLDWVHRTHQPDMIVRGKGGSVGFVQYEDLSTQNLAPV